MGLRRLWQRVAGREEPVPEIDGPPVRAAVYARDQVDDEGKVVRAAAAQLERCHALASGHHWDVVASFADVFDPEGNRPGLRDLRAAVWHRSIDVVIAGSPDQLYLDVERLVRFAREARLLGVELIFVHSPRGLDLYGEDEW